MIYQSQIEEARERIKSIISIIKQKRKRKKKKYPCKFIKHFGKKKMLHIIQIHIYLMPRNFHPKAQNYFFPNYFSSHSFGTKSINECFFILSIKRCYFLSSKLYQLIYIMKTKLYFYLLSIEHSGSQPGSLLSPRNIWQWLDTFLVVTAWGRGFTTGI